MVQQNRLNNMKSTKQHSIQYFWKSKERVRMQYLADFVRVKRANKSRKSEHQLHHFLLVAVQFTHKFWINVLIRWNIFCFQVERVPRDVLKVGKNGSFQQSHHSVRRLQHADATPQPLRT